MMRTLAALSMAGAAFAVTQMEQGVCLVDSGEAVSDALDSSMFVWAATKRCGKAGLETKCEVDVASAVKSVNAMLNVIMRTINKCDGLHTANKECGMQAGKLTEHLAGIAAASGEVVQKCKNGAAVLASNGLGAVAAPVLCSVDLKDTAKDIFKVISAIKNTKKECNGEDGTACAGNALHITGAFAGVGQYLAGTVGQCQRAAGTNVKASTETQLCAQASLALVEYLTRVAADGVELAKKCSAEKTTTPTPLTVEIEKGPIRLYRENGEEAKKGASSFSTSTVLGAFLPATAVFGFLAGKKYGDRREAALAQEMDCDNE